MEGPREELDRPEGLPVPETDPVTIPQRPREDITQLMIFATRRVVGVVTAIRVLRAGRRGKRGETADPRRASEAP